MRTAALRKAMAEAQAAFAAHPDVTLLGIGEKSVNGINTKHPAVIVYVDKKGEPKGRPIGGKLDLPCGLVPADIRELPRSVLKLNNGRLDGSDVLVSGDAGRSGTLGFVSIDYTGQQVFGITNAHVVGPPDHSAVGAPISAQLQGSWVRIGEVFSHTLLVSGGALNPPDVALVRLNDVGRDWAQAYVIQAFPGQPIEGKDGLSPSPNGGSRMAHVYASQAAGGMRTVTAQPIFEISSIPMDDKDPQTGIKKRIRFGRVFHAPINGAVRPGHSGAALTRVQSTGRRVVSGLVVGGGPGNMFAFSFRDVYRHIRDVFGVSL